MTGACIQLTLKTTARYHHWGVETIAEKCRPTRLYLVKVDKFLAQEIEGYQHRKTNSDSQNLTTYKKPGVQIDYAATWFFSPCPPSKPFVPPAWLKKELGRTKPTCDLCDMVFTTDGDLATHLEGQKHSQRLKKLKRMKRLHQRRERKERPNAEPVRCTLCKLSCTSQRDYEMHCQGKRHKSNLPG